MKFLSFLEVPSRFILTNCFVLACIRFISSLLTNLGTHFSDPKFVISQKPTSVLSNPNTTHDSNNKRMIDTKNFSVKVEKSKILCCWLCPEETQKENQENMTRKFREQADSFLKVFCWSLLNAVHDRGKSSMYLAQRNFWCFLGSRHCRVGFPRFETVTHVVIGPPEFHDISLCFLTNPFADSRCVQWRTPGGIGGPVSLTPRCFCPDCHTMFLTVSILLWLGLFHIFSQNCSCLISSGVNLVRPFLTLVQQTCQKRKRKMDRFCGMSLPGICTFGVASS